MAVGGKVQLLAGVAAAGVAVAIVLKLRKYLNSSALENAVGDSPMKRTGKKVMLANKAIKGMKARRGSLNGTMNAPEMARGAIAENGYSAFVSHMKVCASAF